MTSDDTLDPGLKALAGLRPLAPDAVRSERVRARCVARLARSRPRTARVDAMVSIVRRVLAPVLAGAFSLLYVAALVSTALWFFEARR